MVPPRRVIGCEVEQSQRAGLSNVHGRHKLRNVFEHLGTLQLAWSIRAPAHRQRFSSHRQRRCHDHNQSAAPGQCRAKSNHHFSRARIIEWHDQRRRSAIQHPTLHPLDPSERPGLSHIRGRIKFASHLRGFQCAGNIYASSNGERFRRNHERRYHNYGKRSSIRQRGVIANRYLAQRGGTARNGE